MCVQKGETPHQTLPYPNSKSNHPRHSTRISLLLSSAILHNLTDKDYGNKDHLPVQHRDYVQHLEDVSRVRNPRGLLRCSTALQEGAQKALPANHVHRQRCHSSKGAVMLLFAWTVEYGILGT